MPPVTTSWLECHDAFLRHAAVVHFARYSWDSLRAVYGMFMVFCGFVTWQEVEMYRLPAVAGERARQFHYLNQSQCFELEKIKDAEEYHNTRHAMDVIGISKENQVRGLARKTRFCTAAGEGPGQENRVKGEARRAAFCTACSFAQVNTVQGVLLGSQAQFVLSL